MHFLVMGMNPKNRSLKIKIEIQPLATTFEETVTTLASSFELEQWDCGHQVTGISTAKEKRLWTKEGGAQPHLHGGDQK